MRLLALCVGAEGPEVAVLGGGSGLLERSRAGPPAELLPELVGTALAEAGLGWGELEALAVLTGPGSFTAIRAAVAAARALALATGLPIHAASALELGAAACTQEAGPLLVLTPAGRGLVARQRFAGPQEAAEEPVAVDRTCALFEPGPGERLVLVDPDEALLRSCAERPARIVRTSAAALAAFALSRARSGRPPLPGPRVRPLYLRPADARPEAGRPLVARA
ncbi:MAG: tRNA (adenosine(37)-N6)-threonylcarbamoyltransferase complex dimerization subunit type 1 TsaB [Geminicoccaceae bacterium]|nr:tRNA (adenosine(37)-N6)-threonylcarbamoyltransferase complex dimerization subunit type 1 TsaB [Geminicoccaceae bacterium]